MAKDDNAKGRLELRRGLRQARGLFIWVGVFSFFANLLMLTGPLFMLQVYDRVLASRSEATLVALFGLVVFLYGIMALMDYARGRVLARVGARLQSLFDRRVRCDPAQVHGPKLPQSPRDGAEGSGSCPKALLLSCAPGAL